MGGKKLKGSGCLGIQFTLSMRTILQLNKEHLQETPGVSLITQDTNTGRCVFNISLKVHSLHIRLHKLTQIIDRFTIVEKVQANIPSRGAVRYRGRDGGVLLMGNMSVRGRAMKVVKQTEMEIKR